MDKKDFENLSTGDIVRPFSDGRGFIVISNYGNRVTAVTTVDMTNPDEWVLVAKAELKMEKK